MGEGGQIGTTWLIGVKSARPCPRAPGPYHAVDLFTSRFSYRLVGHSILGGRIALPLASAVDLKFNQDFGNKEAAQSPERSY